MVHSFVIHEEAPSRSSSYVEDDEVKHFAWMKDREFFIDRVDCDGRSLRHADPDLKVDRELISKAVIHDACTLQYAAEQLRDDREIVLLSVARNGHSLEYASESLRADKDVVLAAVARHGGALVFASDALRADMEVVRQAVSRNGVAIQYASEGLRSNREFVLEACALDASALQFVSEELKGDREVVLNAVRQNPDAIWYAAEELKRDEEIIHAATVRKADALWYAADSLKALKVFAMRCVTDNCWAFQFVSDELKADKEVTYQAFQGDSGVVKFASESLRDDAEFMVRLCAEDPRAFAYASLALRNNPAFVGRCALAHGWAVQHALEINMPKIEVTPFNLRKDMVKGFPHEAIEAWRLSLRAEHKRGPELLETIRKALIDKTVALRLVAQNGGLLHYLPESLVMDQEISVAAFKQLGVFATDSVAKGNAAHEGWKKALKCDIAFDSCLPESHFNLYYTDAELVALTQERWATAVTCDGCSLRFLPKRWRSDAKVVGAAVAQSAAAIAFASPPALQDVGVLKIAGLLPQRYRDPEEAHRMRVILSLPGSGLPALPRSLRPISAAGRCFVPGEFGDTLRRQLLVHPAFEGLWLYSPRLLYIGPGDDEDSEDNDFGFDSPFSRNSGGIYTSPKSRVGSSTPQTKPQSWIQQRVSGKIQDRKSAQEVHPNELPTCGWWRGFRHHVKLCSGQSGFMIQVIELDSGGERYDQTEDQKMELSIANEFGIKVFTIHEPLEGTKDGLKEAASLAENVNDWFSNDPQRQKALEISRNYSEVQRSTRRTITLGRTSRKHVPDLGV